MPTLLQIDSCLGVGSTGRITESIGALAMERGWDCYIAHGSRYAGSTKMHSIPVVTKLGEYRHALRSLLFDAHGLGSVCETKRLIRKIEQIKPDIIHLHCVHGYYLNYKVLFEYLNSTDIPVVWTFHDCWAFTGHCAHFYNAGCLKWKDECGNCPLLNDYPRAFMDNSKRNYKLKKKLFEKNHNLHIVSVSEWLSSLVKESFLKGKDNMVINNGIDINMFSPSPSSEEKPYILGVASSWNQSKGLFDFYKIREKLSEEEYDIIIVGLTKEQIQNLPRGIKGISRTESVSALAELYSGAFVFVNPTYADSFPTVNIEALACGTPVITYRTGGSPEIIDENTGIVVEQGDIDALVRAIRHLKDEPIASESCRFRAVSRYDKKERFMDYIRLYEKLLNKKK